MKLKLSICLMLLAAAACQSNAWSADIVTDWNLTVAQIIQQDGTHPVHKANPGWSTRSIAMMNTAIYDAFQSINRTHAPFLFTPKAAANTNLDATVNTVAYEILKHCYPGESSTLDSIYNARMAPLGNGAPVTAGVAWGQQIAQGCADNRDIPNDGSDPNTWASYAALDGPGKWRPQPGQTAWGPGWGTVRPFGIPDSATFVNALPALPTLTDAAYTAAFNEVKDFGAVNSAVRNAQKTNTGLFWAYDRPSMGPPPVLFMQNMVQIAEQIGTPAAVNARLFAQASVAQADAAIAAWDAKFADNFWRPIGAIQGDRLDGTKGHDDGNPNTAEDANWIPLGAPGGNAATASDDFTPPFPAWTSGHATMGGAIFKSLALFFGNNFQAADNFYPGDATTNLFSLHSAEFDAAGTAGMDRQYAAFTQDPTTYGLGMEGAENTPESENAMSRIYLGIHWIMDQKDGTLLGENIANYIAGHYFQAVPEPGSGSLVVVASFCGLFLKRRRR